jgi:BON domain-containing protein
MIARGSLLAGAGVGAGLTYFLDPARGARRRARVRDTLVHSAMITRRAIGTASRDIAHRTYGTAASLRSRFRHEPVDDQVLVDRLRAKLGRLVWHPHAIEVSADQGRVTLRGPILTREADHLVRAVERIDGVQQVVDHLERHEQAGNIPALQGGRPPAGDRIDLLRTNWAPTTRVLVGAAGAALAIAGLARRDRNGVIAAVLGAGLVACAATNLPANRLFDWRIDHDRLLQPE